MPYLAGHGSGVKVLLVVHVFAHFLSELPNVGLKLVQEVGRYCFILLPQAVAAEQRFQTRLYRVDQLLVLLVVVTDGAGLFVTENMKSRVGMWGARLRRMKHGGAQSIGDGYVSIEGTLTPPLTQIPDTNDTTYCNASLLWFAVPPSHTYAQPFQ